MLEERSLAGVTGWGLTEAGGLGLFFFFFSATSWLVFWEDEHIQLPAPVGEEAREGTGTSWKSSLYINPHNEKQTVGATGQGALLL